MTSKYLNILCTFILPGEIQDGRLSRVQFGGSVKRAFPFGHKNNYSSIQRQQYRRSRKFNKSKHSLSDFFPHTQIISMQPENVDLRYFNL